MTAEARARDLVDRMTYDLQHIKTHLLPAIEALRDAQPGPRSTPIGDGSRAARNEWAAYDGAVAFSKDAARVAQRDLVKRLDECSRALEGLANQARQWSSVQPNRQSLDDFCQICTPFGDSHMHQGRKVGVFMTCEWAYRWHARNERVPTAHDVRAHMTGRKPRAS